MSEFSGDNREQEEQALLHLAELEAATEVLVLDTEGTLKQRLEGSRKYKSRVLFRFN
jgi:3-dehydroquinate synthase class II